MAELESLAKSANRWNATRQWMRAWWLELFVIGLVAMFATLSRFTVLFGAHL